MKNLFFLIISSFFLFSCEMHKQANMVQGEKEAKVINLTVIATISKAIVQNDIALVKSTLEEGDFEINVIDEDGELILNKAVTSNRFVIASLLLEKGGDPNLENENGLSAKKLIEGSEHESEWLSLFDGGKLSLDFSKELVFNAISDARPDTQERYIDLIKGYIDLGAPLDGTNRGQYTYLMEASSGDLLNVVKLLCSYPETDPNIVVVRGRGRRKKEFTALSLSKSQSVKDELISCGALK
jgi:ankyrin repeat protein